MTTKHSLAARTVAAAGLLFTTAALGAAVVALGPLPPAGASTTPKALLAASLKAAGKAGSVHFVATSSVGNRSISIDASASASAGTQSIVVREGKATGRVSGRYVDKTVYFRGNTVGLEDYLGMPGTLAPKYTGKWISFKSSTQNFAAIAKSMTLSAAVAQISVDAPLHDDLSASVDGRSALSVKGTTTTLSSKGEHGTATLYVAADGAPLPIRYVGTGKQKAQKETGQVVYSHWGAKVAPVAPTGAVPASSITSSASG